MVSLSPFQRARARVVITSEGSLNRPSILPGRYLKAVSSKRQTTPFSSEAQSPNRRSPQTPTMDEPGSEYSSPQVRRTTLLASANKHLRNLPRIRPAKKQSVATSTRANPLAFG